MFGHRERRTVTTQSTSADPQTYLDLDDRWCAHNYHPLPVVITAADGRRVTDVTGKRYLNMLADDSALNSATSTPPSSRRHEQIGKVTLTSRAFPP